MTPSCTKSGEHDEGKVEALRRAPGDTGTVAPPKAWRCSNSVRGALWSVTFAVAVLTDIGNSVDLGTQLFEAFERGRAPGGRRRQGRPGRDQLLKGKKPVSNGAHLRRVGTAREENANLPEGLGDGQEFGLCGRRISGHEISHGPRDGVPR